MPNRIAKSGRIAVSNSKKLELAQSPLQIFGSRLFGYWNSRNVSTNCLTSSTSMANAAWTKNEVTVLDGYEDPFGGTGASLVISNATNGVHRVTQAYTNTVAQQNITVYFKQLSGRNFDLLPNPAACTISPTGTIVSSTSMSIKTESLSNGWIKLMCRYANTVSDGVFRIYPFGNIIVSNAGEQCLIYYPTLNNQQPISIPDLSGNNITFTQNTAGGIVKQDNATILQFGQQSVYLSGTQGYISASPPNEDYTSISIVGTVNGNYNNNCTFEVANADTSQRFVSYYSNNGSGVQQNADIYFKTPTQSVQDLKTLPAAPSGVLGVFKMYNPLTGSVVSKYNNTTLTSSKTGTNVTNTKMTLGNSTSFNLTTGLFWFEQIIVKGAITAADEVALKLYIKENYNQNIY